MVTQAELIQLISKARDMGAIIRTKGECSGDVEAVSIGRLFGNYGRLGSPGTEWMPPIQAAERLREFIFATNAVEG